MRVFNNIWDVVKYIKSLPAKPEMLKFRMEEDDEFNSHIYTLNLITKDVQDHDIESIQIKGDTMIASNSGYQDTYYDTYLISISGIMYYVY